MEQKKNKIVTIEGKDIYISKIQEMDYISLTDMAKGTDTPVVIAKWLSNKNTVEFLGEWESIHNPDFNYTEFGIIKNGAGTNRFTLSVKTWSEKAKGIGLLSKKGRYGRTYAHKDIAFEFGIWISPRFKLLLIKEFDRLKKQENSLQQKNWDYQRFLTKVNYRLHTDTIRDKILPQLQMPKDSEWLVYAEEADLLNMAVFGVTAKQWRTANPELAKKGNIRDHAEILQLNVLANLETLNAFLIEQGLDKEKRFPMLAQTAISQYQRLIENENNNFLGGGSG